MIVFFYIGLHILFFPPVSHAIEIPNAPLSVMVQSPPSIIMLLVDDSTSMNDSILAASDNDVLAGHHYVFKDPDNHVRSSLTNPSAVIPPEKTHSWQARCCMTNRMYYDPRKKYEPWPHWQSVLNQLPDTIHMNPNCPVYHPMRPACLNLDSPYLSTDKFNLSFSHFFMFADKNTNQQFDADEQLILYALSDHDIQTYEVIEPRKGISHSNLRPISFSSMPDSMTLNASGQPMTYTSQRQNFANWFSFHRRKELSVKYYLGQLLDRLVVGWVGIYSFNRSLILPAFLVDNSKTNDENKKRLLKQIYTYASHGDSSLRQAYQTIGDYLDTQSHSIISAQSPFQQHMTGDSCRLAYAVVLTDGQYNGPSPHIGNRDGDGGNNDTLFDGSFYGDLYENTFADVTMFYYEQDLALEIPDKTIAEATHQHIIPLIIHFSSTVLPDTYDQCPPNCPQWPKPLPGTEQTIIDLFHASINGRGLFFNADNPHSLDHMIQQIASYIHDKQTIISSAALTGNRVQTKSRLIETSYYSGDWTGDLKSYGLNPDNSRQAIAQWSAKSVLSKQTERTIVSFNGHSGIPFLSDSINASEMTDETIQAIYKLPLGDIVHSSPVVVENTIWVAANDAMVHAFDLNTGYEKMAYIPKILWPRLHLLHKQVREHQYYIDGNLYVYQKNGYHLMCVSLGRGGKGLFCLNIKENQPQNIPMWEYAPSNDADLGFVQQVYIVRSNCNHTPVVIFGNGYNSDNRQGFLYILNALTGKPLKWNGQEAPKGIPLPASGIDNGLSTPALVDIDSNQTVDFVYAGDLQGNLWKFDCQSSDPNQWRVFFEHVHDNQPSPFFQARASNGQVQPILIRPEVIRHCDSRFEGYLILWGTGKYLEQQDIYDKSIQSLYCIWDWSDYWQNQRNMVLSDVRHMYLGPFKNAELQNHPENRKPDHTPSNVTLQKRTILQEKNSPHSINWDPTAAQSYVGWFMDMPKGERVLFPFTYLGEKLVIVNTFVPNHSPCQNGGTSHVYLIDACNGQHVNDLFGNMGMSVFCQSIEGLLYPPIVQYFGSDQIVLYFTSSIPAGLQPVLLNSNDLKGVQNIFDGKIFYWKKY